MKNLRRLGRLFGWAAALTVFGALGTLVASVSAMRPVDGHSTNLSARLILPDGSSRTVNVQGVGCSISICSRVALRHTDTTRSWLDTIASISDITKGDALFVFKDRTERRLPVVEDNRFLYFGRAYMGSSKIAMDKLKSIEFLVPATLAVE